MFSQYNNSLQTFLKLFIVQYRLCLHFVSIQSVSCLVNINDLKWVKYNFYTLFFFTYNKTIQFTTKIASQHPYLKHPHSTWNSLGTGLSGNNCFCLERKKKSWIKRLKNINTVQIIIIQYSVIRKTDYVPIQLTSYTMWKTGCWVRENVKDMLPPMPGNNGTLGLQKWIWCLNIFQVSSWIMKLSCGHVEVTIPLTKIWGMYMFVIY